MVKEEVKLVVAQEGGGAKAELKVKVMRAASTAGAPKVAPASVEAYVAVGYEVEAEGLVAEALAALKVAALTAAVEVVAAGNTTH